MSFSQDGGTVRVFGRPEELAERVLYRRVHIMLAALISLSALVNST
jgi:hypothetical protein